MDMVLRTPNRRNAAGVTLIEVLVAVTILGIALLALAPMFTNAVRSNASANQMTNTITLAKEKLEELSGYPRSDPRLTVPNGQSAASFINDLPGWYNPKTGATAPAGASPGAGWFTYPYSRTYTVEQFDGNLTTRVTAPAPYVVKLITVTVRPTSGPFPGLRESRQSLYLRVRDAI